MASIKRAESCGNLETLATAMFWSLWQGIVTGMVSNFPLSGFLAKVNQITRVWMGFHLQNELRVRVVTSHESFFLIVSATPAFSRSCQLKSPKVEAFGSVVPKDKSSLAKSVSVLSPFGFPLRRHDGVRSEAWL